MKVGHPLVSGEKSGGNHCNWARKGRIKERAGNGGWGCTHQEMTESGVSFQNFQSK